MCVVLKGTTAAPSCSPLPLPSSPPPSPSSPCRSSWWRGAPPPPPAPPASQTPWAGPAGGRDEAGWRGARGRACRGGGAAVSREVQVFGFHPRGGAGPAGAKLADGAASAAPRGAAEASSISWPAQAQAQALGQGQGGRRCLAALTMAANCSISHTTLSSSSSSVWSCMPPMSMHPTAPCRRGQGVQRASLSASEDMQSESGLLLVSESSGRGSPQEAPPRRRRCSRRLQPPGAAKITAAAGAQRGAHHAGREVVLAGLHRGALLGPGVHHLLLRGGVALLVLGRGLLLLLLRGAAAARRGGACGQR